MVVTFAVKVTLEPAFTGLGVPVTVVVVKADEITVTFPVPGSAT